ncbi:MAG: hypothetical protein ACREM1_20925, partial [Longimicrobiales bacterium]
MRSIGFGLAALERLLEVGAVPDIAADSVFAPLSTAPAFQVLEAEFERNATPILRGQAAFSLPDADLVPEALTWDPARRRWLIGCLAKRKIIAANDGRRHAEVFLERILPERRTSWFRSRTSQAAGRGTPTRRWRCTPMPSPQATRARA